MLSIITSLSVLVVVVAFVFSARAGVLATVMMHPVAAAGWHVNFFIGTIKINPLVAMGLLVPLFVFIRAFSRGPSFAMMPLAGIWTVYLCYNVFAGTLHAIDEGPGQSLNLITRHVAGFVGFYMMQAFFTEKRDFKALMLALAVSGIFPVLCILYQIATGSGTLRELSSGGDFRLDQAHGLVRYSGFYHDIVSVRGYVFQCLTGIILYWAYFLRPNKDMMMKVVMCAFGIACLFVLYKMYSKAVILTLLIWFGVWFFANGRLGLAIFLGLVLVGLNALQSETLFSETGRLFESEISATSDEFNSSRLLHGRVGVWEHSLSDFFNSSIIEQFIGYRTGAGAHNDFLQKLYYGGYIGLIIYTSLLYCIGMAIVRLNLRQKTPINLMAIMIFCGWMIDTIGVVPSLYPGYQWYAWGVIGLAIKGLAFERDAVEAPQKKRRMAPPLAAEGD